MAGDIEVGLGDTGSFAQFHKDRRLQALATTGPNRDAGAPDVSTVAQSGYPAVEITTFNALLAPAGTPAAILARLNAEFSAALQSPDIKERISVLGFEQVNTSQEYLASRIRSEMERWDEVIKTIGLRLD